MKNRIISPSLLSADFTRIELDIKRDPLTAFKKSCIDKGILKDKDFNKYSKKKPKSVKVIKTIDNWARLKTLSMCVR